MICIFDMEIAKENCYEKDLSVRTVYADCLEPAASTHPGGTR